jgi:hypothetical protein
MCVLQTLDSVSGVHLTKRSITGLSLILPAYEVRRTG